MDRGLLMVVSGPSGAGKGTVLSAVCQDEGVYYSVSATTRPMRPGEVDGVNYHFISQGEFEEMIEADSFLEHAEYCGHYYGTPLKIVGKMLQDGKAVILEIEVQGALQIRERAKDAVLVFLTPSTRDELRRRLKKRGSEGEEQIENRLLVVSRELEQLEQYDYIVRNDKLEDAVEELRAIILAERCKMSRRFEELRGV